MGNLIQELPETEEEMQKWMESFEYFVCSICLPDDIFEEMIPNLASEEMIPRFRTVAQGIRNAVIEHKSQIIGIVTNYVGMVQQADDENKFAVLGNIYDTILEKSWNLLERMNSMPTNLKIGNASWNKSIGGAVDPRSWGFQSESVTVFNSTEGLAPVDKLNCVLTHVVDQEQLMWAFAINDKYVNPVTYLYTGIYQSNSGDYSYWTVCSSSNSDSLVNSDWKTEQVPIYSFDRVKEGLVLRY
ncbi:hypothetical protein [Leuconostoc falkenbergense]|uniref:hypothetical protein n=1 Tax=Leuconostoc falkenbergense TaxID=2766470 RepID=UPI0024AE493A|nr:hypothetical protein [Leuconostoc falkenbergense]